MNIVAEQGKTLKDAQDDIICGLGWYIHLLYLVAVSHHVITDEKIALTCLLFCLKRWLNMLVDWPLCKWGSSSLVHLMELIRTASENQWVCVLAYAL